MPSWCLLSEPYPVKKDDEGSGADHIGVNSGTLRLVCLLKYSPKAHLILLSSVAFLLLLTSSALRFDCQVASVLYVYSYQD